MKKCRGCGKWWNENDRRVLSSVYTPPAIVSKRCKSSGQLVSDCCVTHPGDYCLKCNQGA